MEDNNQPPSGFPLPSQNSPLNQPSGQVPAQPFQPQPPQPATATPPPSLSTTPMPPPPAPIIPPQPPQPISVVSTTGTNYADFGKRLVAGLIDSVIIGLAAFAIRVPFIFITGFSLGTSSSLNGYNPQNPMTPIFSAIQQLITVGVSLSYPIYFIGRRGQTPGKMAMKIKVLRIDQKEPPGYMTAFVREVVGKFLSSVVLCLGYFWMLWDDKKQTWHDKIAKTVVMGVG